MPIGGRFAQPDHAALVVLRRDIQVHDDLADVADAGQLVESMSAFSMRPVAWSMMRSSYSAVQMPMMMPPIALAFGQAAG